MNFSSKRCAHENIKLMSQAFDAVEVYFECITTCSLDDGDCVTRCVEQLKDSQT